MVKQCFRRDGTILYEVVPILLILLGHFWCDAELLPANPIPPDYMIHSVSSEFMNELLWGHVVKFNSPLDSKVVIVSTQLGDIWELL